MKCEPLPQLRLRSGRRLHYRTFGPSAGEPLFHFHGIAGSGLDAALYGDAPDIAGVHLISPDRPGLGESDFQPGRTILDWPSDVLELADSLGLGAFSVVGVSGGAPYALACAHEIPQRLKACGIVSGAAPGRLIPRRDVRFRATYFAIHWLPFFYQAFARALTPWRASHPTERFAIPAILLARADAAVLANAELSSILARVTAEGSRQGYTGPALEGTLLAGDWGFRLENINLKDFFLWHGEADRIVPAGVGRNLAAAVPNTRAKFYPGEGHYSVMVNHAFEILTAFRQPR